MVSIDPFALAVLVLGTIFAVCIAIAFGIAFCRGVMNERRRASGE